MTKIIAVVVTFNAEKWIKKCFTSLLRQDLISEVIVIDNCSKDNTASILAQISPRVFVHRNERNLGFGRANNIGIKMALERGADAVLLINQDAWILGDGLSQMAEVLTTNEQIGIVSSVHLDGTAQNYDKAFEGYLSDVLNQEEKTALIKGALKRKYIEAPFVNAACWLVSKGCLERVGLFDNVFVHYGEDNNFVHRMYYHSYKLAVTTKSFLVHDRGNRPANRFHHYQCSRYRTYLICIMDIRVGLKTAAINCAAEFLNSTKSNLRTGNFRQFFFDVLMLCKSLFFFPKLITRRYYHKKKR